jgi:hypothetical protein
MLPLCKLKVYSRLSENVAAVCMERPLSSIDTLSRFLNSFEPSMGVQGLTTEGR